MVTSVRPILANVERPKPRKMSPIPQIAKLTTSTVTTAAMMVLPTQPEDACRRPRSMNLPCCEQRVFRAASPTRAPHNRERALPPQQPRRPHGADCGPTAGLRPAALLGAFRSDKRQGFAMASALRPLIVGNWKMNGLQQSAVELAGIVEGAGPLATRMDLLVCPP